MADDAGMIPVSRDLRINKRLESVCIPTHDSSVQSLVYHCLRVQLRRSQAQFNRFLLCKDDNETQITDRLAYS